MGHLTRIANAVVRNLERGPAHTPVGEVIQGLPADCRGRWESFVEETLTETNRRNAVDLVSTHHLHPSSDDEDMEGAFPNELSLQQAFSEYQVQQMTATFVDQFGFNDEEFADQDDSVNAPFDRITEINFNIDADEDSPSAALFEACCGDHIQPFDDDEDDDIWEDKETRCAARVTARARFGGPHASENGLARGGRDGEEADAGAARVGASPAAAQKEVPRMDSGSEGTWTVFDEPVSPTASAPGVAMDVGSSVWAASAPSTSALEEKGWAKFTDFQPFCCSESGPRCSSPVDTGLGDAQDSRNQGPEKTLGPASPCAWNVCVSRNASLVASDSDEDKQKVAVTSEAVSMGPGRETPPLPTSVPRAPHAASAPPDPASPAPAEATSALPMAAPREAATTALSKASPAPATPAVSVLVVSMTSTPVVAVTTTAPATPAPTSPAVSTVAAPGTGTKDRTVDEPPPAGTASNGPV